MSEMYTEAFLQAIKASLSANVALWGLSPHTTLSLVNISENATFRADDPEAAAPVILRVHRPNYHTRREIASELLWIDALRAQSIASVPRPLTMANGERIAALPVGSCVRDVVAFEFIHGSEPRPTDDLTDAFRTLGAITAKLHAHARRWTRPPGFVRKRWTFGTTVGAVPHWGRWDRAMGLTAEGQRVIERAVGALRGRLAAFGDGPDRFGLIHADLRLANLLVDGERITLIDFDDCGFGWFAFDFAAAVSFFETDPSIPKLRHAWCEGYRTVAPLAPAVVAALPSFVLMRRIQLTAWIASHFETPTAQQLGTTYTAGTVNLAEAYLTEPERQPLGRVAF